MPGPVSHIVYAEKLLSYLPAVSSIAEYRLGTLFPDIRMLNVIKRDATHFSGVTFDDVAAAKNSFVAGMLLHSLVDELREEYVREVGVYEQLPRGCLSTIALKVSEDARLYGSFSAWMGVIGGLEGVLPQELQFGIAPERIQQWHEMHRIFFARSPVEGIREFLQVGGLTVNEAEAVIEITCSIESDSAASMHLQHFYDQLEKFVFDHNKDSGLKVL